jgi:predicted nucleic acid-binding protein
VLLLDTDVMVDLQRGLPSAVAWLTEHQGTELALPGLVSLQLLDGCQNKLDAARVRQFTSAFRRFWPTVADCERAHATHAELRLAHGMDISDMLIAQTAIGLGVPLLTFNTKHFAVIPGLTIEQPYIR